MASNVLFNITYGLYIISSKNEGAINGLVATTVFQVTAEPPQIAIAIHKDNLTTEYVKKSGVFAVSLLNEKTKLDFISHFGFQSGRDANKFDKISYRIGSTGCPIVLENTVAYVECMVKQVLDIGSHIMFVGEMQDSEMINEDIPPLTYQYYRTVIKGTSPKNAPTFEVPQNKSESTLNADKPAMQQYRCTICNYIYDPEEGDPDSDIPPGTAFEDIPDDWKCPVCKIDKSYFVPVED